MSVRLNDDVEATHDGARLPAPRRGRSPRHSPRFGSALPATVLAVLAAASLAGCQVLPWGTDHYRPPAAPLLDNVDCVASARYLPRPENFTPPPRPVAGSIPDGFVPAMVVRCSMSFGLDEGEAGQWSVIIEDRMSGDLAPLVAALGEFSDKANYDIACTADMEIVPDLWLVDGGGRAMLAAWPTTVCGKTKPGVGKALAGLQVAESTRHRIPLPEPAPEPAPLRSAGPSDLPLYLPSEPPSNLPGQIAVPGKPSEPPSNLPGQIAVPGKPSEP
ncbi:hypothetical protein [Arthrobacter sp. 35W]|uniref:hypothetical protein n=1 Tax=Arthrobacter sp. 35W TaxID=1132441 RepID=UPI000415A037|nr:hypothetical protein [Arthrobacter sp. 35W]